MNEHLLTIIVAVFASTGFWTVVNSIIQARSKKLSNRDKLLMGIAHDRICFLGESYLKKGYVNKEDYENLHDYLFVPYEALGGNGTAKRIMDKVDALPLMEDDKVA